MTIANSYRLFLYHKGGKQMRINDFEHLLTDVVQKNLQDINRYVSLLKTIGNNHRYDFTSQLSIAEHRPDATACAEFDFWQKNYYRSVKRGQKGIPTLKQIGENKKIIYVFDVSQTISKNHQTNEISLWKMSDEWKEETFNHLLEKASLSIDTEESSSSKLFNFIRDEVQKNPSLIMNELKVEYFKQKDFVQFLEKSLMVSVSERIGIPYEVDHSILENELKELDTISFMNLGNYLSFTNKQVIQRVMNAERAVIQIKEQTKVSNERYNAIEEKNVNQGGEKNEFRSSTRQSFNEQSGERVSGIELNGRNFTENRGHDTEGIEPSRSNEFIRQGEITISDELRKRESSNSLTTNVPREEFNESSDRNRETSDKIYGENEARIDEELRDNGRVENKRSNEMGRSYEQLDLYSEEDDIRGDSIQLEEVEESTSLFYSKENPEVLMTDEMLERVPKLYAQEGVSLADKEVHAAYFVPFRSNWTWYLTEYDKESNEGFGLVLGFEPEWGYFSLDELRELGTQRLILEDFPKTFRELKDTELKKQLASAMESKRLGMCSKSLFVVPNHLTEQIGREFMQLYPAANIMVATKKDFEPQNRKRFIGKIATGEYDAVIIGHTQFEKIPMSKEYQENHLQAQIDEIIDYIEQYKYSRDQNFTVKQLQNTKKKLETRLKKLNDDFKKDDVITFEELGIDKLYVDEAHNYKNCTKRCFIR